jgi:hypothetical protein
VVSYKIQKKVQKLWGPWLLLVFLLWILNSAPTCLVVYTLGEVYLPQMSTTVGITLRDGTHWLYFIIWLIDECRQQLRIFKTCINSTCSILTAPLSCVVISVRRGTVWGKTWSALSLEWEPRRCETTHQGQVVH